MQMLLLWRCVAVLCVATATDQRRVAIVGAGMGGAAAAHWLRDLANRAGLKLDIDVYERNSQAGGRAFAEHVLGSTTEIEVGASMMIRDNKYMLDAATLLGLPVEFKDQPGPSALLIWDGKTARFVESEWKIVTMSKMLYRYGPLAFNSILSAASSFVKKFDSFYRHQDRGAAFHTFQEFWEAADMLDAANMSCSDYLAEVLGPGASQTLIDEFVGGLTRNNYNMVPEDTTALVCLTSIAPLASGGSKAAWSVIGGNHLIAKGLLAHANTTTLLSTTVERISRTKAGGLSIDYSTSGGAHVEGGAAATDAQVKTALYDAVIIATPHSLDGAKSVQFSVDLGDEEGLPKGCAFSKFKGSHQVVHVTFAAGQLSKTHFGLPLDDLSRVRDVFVPVSTSTKYNSIGLVGSQADGTPIWKFFSTERLSHDDVRPLFEGFLHVIKRYEWHAYPRRSLTTFPCIVLSEGLFFASAAEYGTSAMEVAAVGGRNAAILAARHLGVEQMAVNVGSTEL